MKKISIVMAIIVLIISMIPMKSNAVLSINGAKIYSKGDTDYLLFRDGIERYTYIAVYREGNKEYPAYCMNREAAGVETGTQTVNIENLVTNVMVWRVLINGYPYKSITELGCKTEEEAYMATKQAVYCVLDSSIDPNSYTAVNTDAGRRTLAAFKKILSDAKASTAVKASSELTINQENSLWKVDNLDGKYVSQTFKVTANAGFNEYKVTLQNCKIDGVKIVDENNNEKSTFASNQKFKILLPLTKITEDGNFDINVTGKVNTKPVLYGKSTVSNMQNYAISGYTYEDGTGNKKVYYTKNATEIVIVKKDETGRNILQGVEFQLLDKDKNVIYTGLTTDTNGKIDLNNILPGTYYVKETRTLPGYKLYNDLIKVQLNLNEKVTVNVLNTEDRPKVEIENKETEISVKNENSEIIIKNETNSIQNISKNEVSVTQNVSNNISNINNNQVHVNSNINQNTVNTNQNSNQVNSNINQNAVNTNQNVAQIKLPKTGM